MKKQFSKWKTAPVAVVLLAVYLYALQSGIEQRRILEAASKDAGRISAVALSGWAYAQKHDGLWPELHPSMPFAYAPDTQPESFALAGSAEGPVDDALRGYVLGNFNKDRMMRLEAALPQDDFFYLGYAVDSDEQGIALIESRKKNPVGNQDLPAKAGEGTAGSSTFYRLRNDLPKELAEKLGAAGDGAAIAKRIPVIIQNSKDDFVWVIFLDFHAERLPFPGPFPASERFMDALRATRE